MNDNVCLNYIERMRNKAKLSRGKYRVVAIAFTNRGNFLGISMNGFRMGLSNRKGSGDHAETKLMRKFGKRISKIYIMRFGNELAPLPIHPCANCAKVAEKYGIKIISLSNEHFV